MVGRAESQNILIRRRCLQLRAHGFTYREIAEKIAVEFERNYTYKNVGYSLGKALQEVAEETSGEIQELREMEIVRYDLYLSKLRDRVELGDVEAINSALKISQQRAKLLGLFVPVEVKVEAQVVERVEGHLTIFLEMIAEDDEIPEFVKDRMVRIWEKQFEEIEGEVVEEFD